MEFLNTGFNILLIIVGFGVLIFIHELGHFIAAKWAGIRTEAFAVGMGPVALAWRKGIGLRFGSTAAEYERRVEAFLGTDSVHKPGDLPQAEMYRVGDKLGLGETEYSLRWLPLGGFVKMLGQEDANPNYVSNDPRSYTRCPVGKRMIVVSAGVIMNIILALVFFVIAFMAGVRFDAPVVGDVSPRMPAGTALAENAAALGVETIGLQSGDLVTHIDGKPAQTFTDLQIASAMSKPGDVVRLEVRRAGVASPLHFTLTPQRDAMTGLLGIGVYPGASATLSHKDETGILSRLLQRSGLTAAGVEPGMTLLSANGHSIETYGQLEAAANRAAGEPLHTIWTDLREPHSPQLTVSLQTEPELITYRQHDADGDLGLFGLSPLTRIRAVDPKSANQGVLRAGDIIIRVNSVAYPRRSQMFAQLQANKRGAIDAAVLRDGREQPVQMQVDRDGKLLVEIENADDVLITAQPIASHARYRSDDPTQFEEVPTPVQSANLLTTGGTRILDVNGQSVSNWRELREALRQAVVDAEGPAAIPVRIAHPIPGNVQEQIQLIATPADIDQLRGLGWGLELPSIVFEPIQVTLSAEGSPLRAISMGFAETKKVIISVYLTIDRLVRGSVGVEQLRGPVGIIHIGSKVADRGFMWVLFFLGMISVNLAVINFLPMPIVDGGLFLFLVYEKFKGQPPPLAFQNAATIVGICLIGALFLVTFYNDVLRLVS